MGNESQTKSLPEDLSLYKWKVLFTVSLGTIMCAMDFSIAYIAFPTLTKVFNSEITIVMWVSLAYNPNRR